MFYFTVLEQVAALWYAEKLSREPPQDPLTVLVLSQCLFLSVRLAPVCLVGACLQEEFLVEVRKYWPN